MQRRNRLGSQSLIRRAYQAGARARFPGAAVTGLIEGDGEPRIAVVASRRVGGAVVRNRARRRLRAVIDALLPAFRRGSVAVVAATPETPLLPFQNLSDSVRRGIEKIGLSEASSRTADA